MVVGKCSILNRVGMVILQNWIQSWNLVKMLKDHVKNEECSAVMSVQSSVELKQDILVTGREGGDQRKHRASVSVLHT